jgi:predicted SnoaL-like aldol condensation-catalyzing enzyme
MGTAKAIVIEHVKNGTAGVPGTTTPVRVLVDGDQAVVHGEYQEGGAKRAVFSVLTLAGDRVADAQAVSQEQPPQTVSGRTMLDGPAEPADLAKTEANKALVRSMITEILIGGNLGKVMEYFSLMRLDQHNPLIGDGLMGLQAAMGALAKQGITVRYGGIRHLVGEGNFVFAQSEGTFAGKPYLFCDLYRVDGGKIIEHWDVMAEKA